MKETKDLRFYHANLFQILLKINHKQFESMEPIKKTNKSFVLTAKLARCSVLTKKSANVSVGQELF